MCAFDCVNHYWVLLSNRLKQLIKKNNSKFTTNTCILWRALSVLFHFIWLTIVIKQKKTYFTYKKQTRQEIYGECFAIVSEIACANNDNTHTYTETYRLYHKWLNRSRHIFVNHFYAAMTVLFRLVIIVANVILTLLYLFNGSIWVLFISLI